MNYKNCYFTALMFSSLLLPSQHILASTYEDTLTIKAQTIFQDTTLKGPHYTVQSSVTTDGFLTKTSITSDFGTFEAIGPGMLNIRLNEIDALVKLQTFEASEEFKNGAKASADEKWTALKELADKPKETLKGVGEGIGRFFNRTVRTTKTGIQKMDDVLHDRVPGTTETAGPGAKLPGASTTAINASQSSKYTIAAKASGDLAVNILGFDDSRRKLAKRLEVDPYTSNHILSDKLDEVTWSIFAGDLGVDIVTGLIPGGTLVSSSTMVTNWVWDTPPGDLRIKIEEKLLAMAIDQETVDRLLRHRYYSLTMQAAIAAYLEPLKSVNGKMDIMPLALSVTSVDQARFVVGTLMMISQYHQKIHPVSSLVPIGTIVARIDDGTNVILAPVDYLSWSKTLDTFSNRVEFKDGPSELYIAGVASEKVQDMLKQRSWKVNEKSTLFGLTDR